MDWTAIASVWGTIIAAAGAYAYTRRHGGGRALEELALANSVLERRLSATTAELRKQSQVIGALEQRTNLEPMVASVVDQFTRHEQRAAERHREHMRSQEGVLSILDLIADRLGPERDAA